MVFTHDPCQNQVVTFVQRIGGDVRSSVQRAEKILFLKEDVHAVVCPHSHGSFEYLCRMPGTDRESINRCSKTGLFDQDSLFYRKLIGTVHPVFQVLFRPHHATPLIHPDRHFRVGYLFDAYENFHWPTCFRMLHPSPEGMNIV